MTCIFVGWPLPAVINYPPDRGAMQIGAGFVQRHVLPTDPVGLATVTFSGVNANSEIRIYLPDSTEAAGIENCLTDHVLSWSVYSTGSANNTVRVVIVHPDYKIKEFTYLSTVGNQSIPVLQELDKWYSNPV